MTDDGRRNRERAGGYLEGTRGLAPLWVKDILAKDLVMMPRPHTEPMKTNTNELRSK
jgi:hypothetical protein